MEILSGGEELNNHKCRTQEQIQDHVSECNRPSCNPRIWEAEEGDSEHEASLDFREEPWGYQEI